MYGLTLAFIGPVWASKMFYDKSQHAVLLHTHISLCKKSEKSVTKILSHFYTHFGPFVPN